MKLVNISLINYHDTLSPYRYIRQDNVKLSSGYSLNTLTSKQIDSTDKLPRKADWHLYMSKHKKKDMSNE